MVEAVAGAGAQESSAAASTLAVMIGRKGLIFNMDSIGK
jgi:hypothetical protein